MMAALIQPSISLSQHNESDGETQKKTGEENEHPIFPAWEAKTEPNFGGISPSHREQHSYQKSQPKHHTVPLSE